jgi:hypothetical protein
MDTGLSRNSHSCSSPSGARAQGLAAFIPCSHRGDRDLFSGPLSTSSCVGNGAGADLQQSIEQALCLQKGDHQSRRMATIRQHFSCSPAPSALVDTACGACMMRRYVPSRVNMSPYAATSCPIHRSAMTSRSGRRIVDRHATLYDCIDRS